MTGALRFTRRFLVVCIATTAVIGLGFAWRVSPASSLVADGGRRDPARVESFPRTATGREPDRRPGEAPIDAFDRRRNDAGFSPGRFDDVVQTLAIEGAILVGIVLIDRQRRRRKPVVPSGMQRPPT